MRGLLLMGVLLAVAAFLTVSLIAGERPVTGHRGDQPIEKPDYAVATEITHATETVIDTVIATTFFNIN